MRTREGIFQNDTKISKNKTHVGYCVSIGDTINTLAVTINSKVSQSQTIEIDTLKLSLPLSERSWAVQAFNTRQSELVITEEIPSRVDLVVPSHVTRLPWPFSSNLY
jgi:hypothetical protein